MAHAAAYTQQDDLRDRGIDLNVVPGPIRAVNPTGSRWVCTPPVMDTDIDIVVWVKNIPIYAQTLLDNGWSITIDDETYGAAQTEIAPFITARKGEYNLIVYAVEEGFRAFCAATYLAKQRNISDKDARVALFKSFLKVIDYGVLF